MTDSPGFGSPAPGPFGSQGQDARQVAADHFSTVLPAGPVLAAAQGECAERRFCRFVELFHRDRFNVARWPLSSRAIFEFDIPRTERLIEFLQRGVVSHFFIPTYVMQCRKHP